MVRIFTVDGLGEDLGAGGFAGAARTGEKIGVAEPPGLELAAQRVRHALLPHNVRKGLSVMPAMGAAIRRFLS